MECWVNTLRTLWQHHQFFKVLNSSNRRINIIRHPYHARSSLINQPSAKPCNYNGVQVPLTT
ncbi:hypothetical protein BIW11_11030 [Tropilaelaps mercedesae]|uniref:Uncharacterized protein n=1 Tax=Tropilaelaps mercedesae TaxID=418985 RepID=A0A1V9XCX6_9ACAR|nr:hypothetical protein BIW11_11030 [Tropilaelaps mercedesae]